MFLISQALCWFVGVKAILGADDSKETGQLEIRIKSETPGEIDRRPAIVDPEYCGQEILKPRRRTSEKGYLTDFVVWLDGNNLKTTLPADAPDRRLRIRRCQFDPSVVFIWPNQHLVVERGDPINFDLSFVGTKKFRRVLSLPPNLRSQALQFEQPDLIKVTCLLHPWMEASVFVKSHDFYRQADSNGRAEFRKVPVGTYDLYVWQNQIGTLRLEKTAVVSSGKNSMELQWENLQAKFEMESAKSPR